ncbi:probable D-lactate dehydrogenase, mitochondrial [Liolophura sinensis]|uniref:probable D-lactate dehydrogenase, mitochondrial n=1 Tax=Liolophura sinensis TaxID=3198878 RepID=UPI003159511C
MLKILKYHWRAIASLQTCNKPQSVRCLSEQTVRTLRDLLGKENVSVTQAVREQHSTDEGFHQGKLPDVVVYPGDRAQVCEVMRLCYVEKLPVVPYGMGTGLEGGVIPVQGGLCLDLSCMNQILSVHSEDFDCCVEPGVTRQTLNTHLRDTGLWFPVDPGADASLCGMCATSASGTNAVRYGTMRENVLNLEVVLSDGRVLNTAGEGRRTKKTSAGYNLTNFLVGSEGTLGIITKATLKLHGIPEAVISAVCHFPTVQAAVDTSVQILQCGLPIARMEFMDEDSMVVVNKAYNTSYQELPSLFLEFHGSSSYVSEQADIAGGIAELNGGQGLRFARDEEERSQLWKARHNIFWLCRNQRPNSIGYPTDVCVPISKLPGVLTRAREAVHREGLWGPILGHVGDGNFHVTFFMEKDDQEEILKVQRIANEIAEDALAVGGTCTGEHGVGLGKRSLLAKELGETAIDVLWQLKRMMDPQNIMNPGKVLPPKLTL